MDDASLATHAKARALFLDEWEGCTTLVMGGSGDARAEAEAYEAQLRALPAEVLPLGAGGLPVFDMALIGVGDDGHVGSLYPGRDEVTDASGRWVLPVEMKTPGSITLSLGLMAAAKEVIIAACGVSDKYPQVCAPSPSICIYVYLHIWKHLSIYVYTIKYLEINQIYSSYIYRVYTCACIS